MSGQYGVPKPHMSHVQNSILGDCRVDIRFSFQSYCRLKIRSFAHCSHKHEDPETRFLGSLGLFGLLGSYLAQGPFWRSHPEPCIEATLSLAWNQKNLS